MQLTKVVEVELNLLLRSVFDSVKKKRRFVSDFVLLLCFLFNADFNPYMG